MGQLEGTPLAQEVQAEMKTRVLQDENLGSCNPATLFTAIDLLRVDATGTLTDGSIEEALACETMLELAMPGLVEAAADAGLPGASELAVDLESGEEPNPALRVQTLIDEFRAGKFNV